MLLSTQLQYSDDPVQSAESVVAMEAAGLDVVWVAEAYSFDAVSLMGYLAARTERVQIGSGILPIYSRTPTLTAMTAAGLDALSNGRAILGLGKPLKLINHPRRAEIPIWVAALGDKNVEMTAELANGWLPHVLMPEKLRGVFGPALDAGLAKRAPELGPLQITGGGFLALEEEMFEPARQLARGMYALYIGGMGARGRNFYNTVFSRQGYPDAARLVQDLYLDGRKDEAAAALPDDFIDRVTLIGPPAHVQERIAALREAGVTHLHVTPVTADVPKLLSQVKEWIS